MRDGSEAMSEAAGALLHLSDGGEIGHVKEFVKEESDEAADDKEGHDGGGQLAAFGFEGGIVLRVVLGDAKVAALVEQINVEMGIDGQENDGATTVGESIEQVKEMIEAVGQGVTQIEEVSRVHQAKPGIAGQQRLAVGYLACWRV